MKQIHKHGKKILLITAGNVPSKIVADILLRIIIITTKEAYSDIKESIVIKHVKFVVYSDEITCMMRLNHLLMHLFIKYYPLNVLLVLFYILVVMRPVFKSEINNRVYPKE